MSKIIFCIFLKKDWDIYSRILQFYFPCEEIEQEHFEKGHVRYQKSVAKASEIETNKEEESESAAQLEEDVRNIDNIPSVCMSDFLPEESKQDTGISIDCTASIVMKTRNGVQSLIYINSIVYFQVIVLKIASITERY